MDFGISDAIGIGSALLSYIGGEERNQAQLGSAREQMAFQERMSNTSYQRAVADLNAAGLNPMLAYAHGGASTPAGSQANIEDTLTPAVNTGKEVYRASNEASVQRAQVDDITASAGLKRQDTLRSSAETAKAQAETETAVTQATLNAAMAEKARQETVTSGVSADLMRTQGQHITAQIGLVAPQIRELVSRADLNDASRRRLIAELPLISSQVVRTKAETQEAFERRLLTAAERRIADLKLNEATAHSDFYDSSYGRASPYVNSAAGAIGQATGGLLPWAIFGRSLKAVPEAPFKIPSRRK